MWYDADMAYKETFTITEDHLKLLKRMYVGWQDCEYGAPEIDPKRPYGNSDVARDVAEILGWVDAGDYETDISGKQSEDAEKIHREMQTVLQIGLYTGSFAAGTYENTERYGFNWRSV
jgi:hypothetical protein